MYKYGILLCGALFLMGCKSISIQQESYKTTNQQFQLGTVGESKDFLLERDYNHTAIPTYSEPIKVNVHTEAFTKSSYMAFVKAKTELGNDVNISFTDSIADTPRFLKLEIADRVAILNALGDKTNADIKRYLQNKNTAQIVTTLALAFNKSELNALITADEVHLERSGIKLYALKTYKESTYMQTIHFNQGVVFAYQSSCFCWQENEKHRLNIVDLVESSDYCPENTYKSAKSAKNKINYYKF